MTGKDPLAHVEVLLKCVISRAILTFNESCHNVKYTTFNALSDCLNAYTYMTSFIRSYIHMFMFVVVVVVVVVDCHSYL